MCQFKIIGTRNLRYFSKEEFLVDIELKQWDAIGLFSDPNKNVGVLFGKIRFWPVSTDPDAPTKSKTMETRSARELRELKKRKRNFLKKGAKAERTKDQSCWAEFKIARNDVNNSLNMPNANVLPITLLLTEMIPVNT